MIQSAYRGHVARVAVKQLRREVLATTAIQTCWRRAAALKLAAAERCVSML
jgi:hypothetical protein